MSESSVPQMNAVDLGDLATDLRDIADAVDGVAMSIEDGDGGLPRVALTLLVQPYSDVDDADKTRAIDMFATAVLGKPGGPVEMGSGVWHHHVAGVVGRVHVRMFGRVDDGERRERRAMQARIDALQTEVEQLRKDGAR